MKKKNIRPRNGKGHMHGYWEVYWDGQLDYKCFYVNGWICGYDEYHYGNMGIKRYYLI